MDLTKGNITKQLLHFSWPIVLSLICSMAYTLSDSIIVSKFCGQSSLATIASISSVVMLAYILINGFANAFTIIASKNIDSKEKVFNHAITICGIAGIVMILIFLLGSNLFVRMMNVPIEIQTAAANCLRVYGLSLLPAIFLNVYTSLFNGFNEAKLPSFIAMASNGFNIILDLLFLAVFHLPVIYAVYASLISIMLGALVLIISFNTHYHLKLDFHLDKDFTFNTLKLSTSMMLQQSAMNICGMFISMKINTLGVELININTACENILNLFILASIGFAHAFSIFLGTNLGKKQYHRMNEGFLVALKVGFVIMVLTGIVAYITFPIILDFYIADLSNIQKSFASLFKIVMIITFIPYFIKYLIDAFPKAYEELSYYMISSLINMGSRMVLLYILMPYINVYSTIVALLISISLAAIYNIYIYYSRYHRLLIQETN